MSTWSQSDLAVCMDTLCPMHLILNEQGGIVHAGPTLHKLRPGMTLPGMDVLDLFDVIRPKLVTAPALLARQGEKLHLQFRAEPQTVLKGVLRQCGGLYLLNLSFGISVLESIRDYELTNADFAPTDMMIEMLYLIEAKSAAMEASRTLNQRLQGAKIAAEEQAFTDTLTGLKNRRAMDHVLARLLTADRPFALMHLDLDFFKAVNDTMGHAAGDHVLQHIAQIMVDEVREQDTVARVGGDEFVIIFQNVGGRETLARIASRLIEQMEKPIPFGGQDCTVSASIGIVLSADYETPTAATLLNDADEALYASKRKGRACYSFY